MVIRIFFFYFFDLVKSKFVKINSKFWKILFNKFKMLDQVKYIFRKSFGLLRKEKNK